MPGAAETLLAFQDVDLAACGLDVALAEAFRLGGRPQARSFVRLAVLQDMAQPVSHFPQS